ncbi:hypothetical protein UPYG_G00248640 [Umbra pygmaea]|uniref:C2H2-type domain-containing protein n=1 Tax=Umbra pygmaea TaxID=75934 RepID=A0ABD0WNP8_UMBPY
MTNKEIFQTQLSHIMGVLVESSVREMGRLLEDCVAFFEGEENSSLKSEMERLKTTNTVKFAAFMDVLSKYSIEQILLLLNMDEEEVALVERTGSEAVISINPEITSCVVIIGQQQELRRTISTQNKSVKEESCLSHSDEQDPDPAPLPTSDEDWLPDNDEHADHALQAPPAARVKRPRCSTVPDKRAPGRSEEDPDVQCVDSADPAHKSSLICSHCGKCFKKKWDLNRHIQTHTKPYNCSTCGRGFNLARRLAEHSKKHLETREGLTDQEKTHSKEKTRIVNRYTLGLWKWYTLSHNTREQGKLND